MTVVGEQERVLVSEVVDQEDDERQSHDQVDLHVVFEELSEIFELFPVHNERGEREYARESEIVEDLAKVKAGVMVLSIANYDAIVGVNEGDKHEDDDEVRAGLSEINDANYVGVDEFSAPKVLTIQPERKSLQSLQHTDLAVILGSARLVISSAYEAPNLRWRSIHKLNQVGVLSFDLAGGCGGVDVLGAYSLTNRFDFGKELLNVGQDDQTKAECEPDDVGLSESDRHKGRQCRGSVKLLELKVVREQEEESGADIGVVEELKEVVQREQADRKAAQDVDKGPILEFKAFSESKQEPHWFPGVTGQELT